MYTYYNNLLVAITCTPSLRPNERYNDHKARVITIHLTMSRDLKTSCTTQQTEIYPKRT